MRKLTNKRLAGISSGVAASIALHALVAAVLLFKMPMPHTEPEKEETIQVDLVPPPEEKKEEPKPEEKKPEEQAKKEEPPPPPPPEEKKPEEKAKEEPPPPPPEEKKAEEPKPEEKKPEEQAKQEEPPPPPPPSPPPPPPEEKKAEEPKSEPPKAEQDAENKQTDGNQGQGAPMPVLKPVFQFGDKDSGPKKSDTGNSSTGEVKPATSAPDHKDETGEPKPAADAGDKPDAPKQPPAKPVPEDIDLPQVDIADAHSQNNAPAADAAGAAITSIEQAKPIEEKTAEPDKPDAPKKDELAEAKTLFSPDESDDPVARTAMLGIPRGRRAAQLCSTELREQLVHGSPSYRPVIVPMYGLAKGTVLDVKRGAFRTAETWYDVQFRCEVNEDATAIVSFALDVGNAVPRSQWRSRRFPE